MRLSAYLLLIATSFAACSHRNTDIDPSAEAAPMKYPSAPRADVFDEYHGTRVADPFRPLENPDAPETRSWIEAENALTESWLAQIPARPILRARLEELWNFERFSAPSKQGGRYFYFRNDGLQNQSVLYVVDRLDGEPRVLLDPNTLSSDGTVSLAESAVSEDGKYLAYATADGGSDWTTWKIREVDTGKDLADELKWVKFSGASWTHDGKGFYYARYDEPSQPLEQVNLNQKLYYHAVGTPQSADKLIYARPDQPEWGFGTTITEDGRTLVISIWQGTEQKNRIYLRDAAPDATEVTPLLDGFDAYYNFIGKAGSKLYFSTDKDAPRGRVSSIDLATFRPGAVPALTEILPQSADTLDGVSLVGGNLIASYLHDARAVAKVYSLDGAFLRDVAFPGLGTAGGFGGKSTDTETFYTYTSYETPATVYRYDVASGESSIYRQPKVKFNPADFETEQVFYPSKDGTKIPMFLVHKKGLVKNGANPTLLYGYGGFNISLTPSFSVQNLVWMENGGIYAVANLRGGGEYGREWHEGGILDRKQNVFDDFASAAEWLIAHQYTNPDKLAIRGGSNGGLLVGASITQRPDLFKAAIPQVGVLDMLRYHQFTIGWAWASDYGTVDDAKMFKYLLGYSPYHNVRPGTRYPATLITTGDHDDRVVPAHSFKFAAALQESHAGAAPVLIRIETRGGHGAGKPTAMLIDEAADIQAFLAKELGMMPAGVAKP
jgi:prolyl oligopeptidase